MVGEKMAPFIFKHWPDILKGVHEETIGQDTKNGQATRDQKGSGNDYLFTSLPNLMINHTQLYI